ncbi:thiaminase II [Labilibaculum filiforme]|uniref:Aminopyrimidine aminohydrolase n=1 Tax=Labilibaculum filiforme TaxID=1940526 RepID=A0A2N3HVK2_9BACT|nr:thiaminase II [Labilibaculum filiforme]
MKPEGDFTHSLWEAIQPVYNKLIDHSFVNKLADGTLAHTSFAHYLSQDVLYIRDDAKALKELSEKAAKSTEKSFFISLANDGIAIEQELHNHFLEHFKVIEAKEKSPVIKAYTNFLLEHSAKSSYGIAAAALLPCYWIYYVVGKHIVLNATKNNKYQKWIDTYQGDEFGYYTKNFIRIVERIAKTASSTEKEKMTDAFVTAGKFELNFFNEAIMK